MHKDRDYSLDFIIIIIFLLLVIMSIQTISLDINHQTDVIIAIATQQAKEQGK